MIKKIYFFTSMPARRRHYPRESRGIALILVMFILMLGSIIVTQMTYSAYIGARANAVVERSVAAEYLLKSALNFAITLIQADPDPNVDGPKDIWAKFSDGLPIPPEILGITEPNVRLALEITPEDRKFRISQLVASGTVSRPLADAFLRLFQLLNFDNDKEIVQSGPFKGQFFNAQQLLSNLIDYQDANSDSDTEYASGIEGELKPGYFPNKPITRVQELISIPGFTRARMRILELFLSVNSSAKVNINFATEPIIRALFDNIANQQVQAIIDYRNSDQGPFKGSSQLQVILGAAFGTISQFVGYESRYFQIIAKIDYGTKAYFLRAYVNRSSSPLDPPEVRSIEYF